MKILLTKDEVASALAEYYGNHYGVEISAVRVTPFGEHIAEISFKPELKWEPPADIAANSPPGPIPTMDPEG